MIDLHNHMLWDWDDGPDDRHESEQMMEAAVADGIRTVAVTPHLFRLTRHGNNLPILRTRMLEFKKAMAGFEVDIHWGAEVFIHPEMVRTVEKYRFTLDETCYVFIEFPSEIVPAGAENMISGLMGRGFVPVISHPERNHGFRERPDLLYHFVGMGCVVQLTAGSLTGEFGREARSAAGLFLENNLAHIIASDSHGAERRRPVLSDGVEAAARIVDREKAEAMVTTVPKAMLDNLALPDMGEPRNPLFRRTWTGKLFRRDPGGG